MIIALFLILGAISLILILLSYIAREGVYGIVGFSFLFILASTIILPGSLQLESGENVTISTDNTTGITTETHTIIYSPWASSGLGSNIWFGLYLILISAIGIFISIIETRGGEKD